MSGVIESSVGKCTEPLGSRSLWQEALKNRLLVAGGIIVGGLIILALMAPAFTRWNILSDPMKQFPEGLDQDVSISDALYAFIIKNGLLDHVSENDPAYEHDLHREKLRIFTHCADNFKALLGDDIFMQLCNSSRSVINATAHGHGHVAAEEPSHEGPTDINATFFDWWWMEHDAHTDNLNADLNVFIEKFELEAADVGANEVPRYAGRKMDIIIACREHFEEFFDAELIDSFIIDLSGHKIGKDQAE